LITALGNKMNSHYYFVTIHGHYTIAPQEVEEAIKKQFPSADIKVSDKDFENVR